MTWDSLKYEIINIQEQELEKEALGVLQAIATTLSHSSPSTKPTSPLAQYLRPIIKECNVLLQEPHPKRAKTAAQILYTLSVTSAAALFLLVNGVVPSSIIIYETEETIQKKTALLEVFTKLSDSACVIEIKSEGSEVPAELRNPLAPFKDRLYELASSALMGGSSQEMPFRIAAIKLLFHLCSLRHCLQQNEIGLMIKYFGDLILSEDPDGKGDLKAEAAQALVGISKVQPSLVQDISLPEFISRLPDSSVANTSDYITVLEGLAQLSVEQSIAHTLAQGLLEKLRLVLKQDPFPAYPRALLSTLFYIWNRRNEFEPPTMDIFYDVIGFIRQAAQASVGCAPITALNEESVMEELGRLANLIVRRADADKQQFVGSHIYSLFTSEPDAKPLPFKPGSSKEQRMTMVLSAWLMASIRSTVRSPSQEASIVKMLTKNLGSDPFRGTI
jgi:DNA repair/transcription protein MET18/MMS19